MSNWQLNDSLPASLAQSFDAAPAEQAEQYWGGPLSIEMPSQSAGVVHSGQASAVCAATTLATAKRVTTAISSVSGAGTVAVTAKRVVNAPISSSGVGTTQVAAERVLNIAISASGVATSLATAKKILIASASPTVIATAIASALRRVGASLSSSIVTTAAASAARRIGAAASSSAASSTSASPDRVSMAISASLGSVDVQGSSKRVVGNSVDIEIGMIAICIPTLGEYNEQPTEQPRVPPQMHTSVLSSAVFSQSHKGKGKASLNPVRSTASGGRVSSSNFEATLSELHASADGGVSSAVERAWPKDESIAREWAFSKDENEALQVLTGLYEVADFNRR